jgi:hypothetical protein
MNNFLPKLAAKVVQTILVAILQVIGGCIAGVALVVAIDVFFFSAGEALGLAPGNWKCSTEKVGTIERARTRFEVEAETCAAGHSFIQTTTTVRASPAGEESSFKVFEYLTRHSGAADLRIEEVDVHTMRIVMPAEKGIDREAPGVRYLGLRRWREMKFLYSGDSVQ